MDIIGSPWLVLPHNCLPSLIPIKAGMTELLMLAQIKNNPDESCHRPGWLQPTLCRTAKGRFTSHWFMCFLFFQLVHHPKEGDKKLMMLDILFVPKLVLQLQLQLALWAEKSWDFVPKLLQKVQFPSLLNGGNKLNHELSWEEKLNISLLLTWNRTKGCI